MNRKIIIYKDKITSTDWDKESGTWVEKNIAHTSGSIPKYFNRVVEVHPDVTVYDFMKHLETYESVIDYFFSDFSKEIPLRLFLNELEKDAPESDLEDVELFWEGEIIEAGLSVTGYLRGWLPESKVKELGEEYDIPRMVNFLPINTWKNCKFMLSEYLPIIDFGSNEEIRNELVFEGLYRWTLFEVISNFIAELSNGSPIEDRDKLFSEMQNKQFNIQEVSADREKSDFWLFFLASDIEETKLLMDIALEKEEYEKLAELKLKLESAESELKKLSEAIDKNDGKTKRNG